MYKSDEFIYNHERKDWYIESVSDHVGTARNIENMFAKAKNYEELYGKDLCNWNIKEIIRFMKTLGTTSRSLIFNYISVYKKYTDFCIYHKMVDDNINHYEEITHEMIDNATNKAKLRQEIITREELLKGIEKLNDSSDKFLLLAIFEGVMGTSFSELRNVHTTDIEGNKLKLCTGREIEISNALKRIAYEAAEETTRTSYGTVDTEYVLQLNLEDPTLILKPRKGRDKIGNTAFNVRIKKILDFIGYEQMSGRKVLFSGAMKFIDQEAKKYDITAEQFLQNRELQDDLKNQYSEFDMANRRAFLNRFEEYLKL